MADTIWIISTRGPDDEPVCELSWAGQRWHAPVADVRQTAMDLVSCAAYAEFIHLSMTKLGLPPATVEAVTLDLMRAGGRTRDHGTDATIDVFPASGTVRVTGKREPRLILKRGDLDGMVTITEARQMAADWMAAAEATESDQLVAEAFRAALPGYDAAADRLFGYLRELRDHG